MKKFIKKRLLYIINGLGFAEGVSVGGSDKRAAEIGQRLADRGFEVATLTTRVGQKILEKEGLKAKYFLTPPPFWWRPSFAHSTLGRLVSYLHLTLMSANSLPPDFKPDIVYATSDFFFDILPAKKISAKKGSKFIMMCHHIIQPPKKRRGPLLTNLFLYLSQQYGFRKTIAAQLVFLYATPEGKQISQELQRKGIDSKKIVFVKNGIDLKKIKAAKANKNNFEAVTVSGLRESKGISDFVTIWSKVKTKLPNARWLIIGGGEHSTVKNLKKNIERAGLKNSIIFLGPKSKKDLYPLLKSAKVFLSPSYEEGWGIAVSEAIAAGLPVVVYNLPAYKIFTDNRVIMTAPLGDPQQLADIAIRLLTQKTIIEEIKKNASRFISSLDWIKIAQEEAEILNQIPLMNS